MLRELRRLSPDARLAVLASPRAPEGLFDRAAAVGAEAVNPHFTMVNENLVRRAHEQDLAVFVYTVNTAERQQKVDSN